MTGQGDVVSHPKMQMFQNSFCTMILLHTIHQIAEHYVLEYLSIPEK